LLYEGVLIVFAKMEAQYVQLVQPGAHLNVRKCVMLLQVVAQSQLLYISDINKFVVLYVSLDLRVNWRG